MFASLAAQCVPTLCDGVVVDVTEGSAHYRIAYPPKTPLAEDRLMAPADHVVRVDFHHHAETYGRRDEGDDPRRNNQVLPVAGVVSYAWRDRLPSPADHLAAVAFVDQAVRTVAWQQSEMAATAAAARADNLEVALQSSRRIGAAIGVLMTRYKITETQASDLLRMASQNSHRKLREIADDVCLTGTLDVGFADTVRVKPVHRADEGRGW